MKKTLLTLAALVSVGTAALAVETQTWLHSSEADFLKGKLEKLSVRSDGRLMLAPKTVELLDSSAAALWAVAEDANGNIYAGGGGAGDDSAKLFRISPAGESEVVAEVEGLQVQAIAVSPAGEVFAATAPDGEIYRLTGSGAESFYNPKAKYVWALVFDTSGNLYAGTGDRGEVHKISSDGSGSVFFETEETHVRSMAMDNDGNLIVGTEPGGLIMRISQAGEGFVLHQADKQEISAVAVAPDGSIYAAAMGTKKKGVSIPRPITVRPATARPAQGAASGAPQPQGTTGSAQAPKAPVSPLPTMRTRVSGGSELIRIEPDGYPRQVWSDKQELVYSIVTDKEGRAVFGTGNEGRIYRLDNGHVHTMLVDVAPTQITALHASSNGKIYAATSNVGKLFQIGPELETEGSYEGDVLDADFFSYWGRIQFDGDSRGGAIALHTRSGNLDRPQQNWSEWQSVPLNSHDGRVPSPASRFLQYRLTLTAASNGASPEVSSVEAAYLHKNVAPVVRRIAATPPNYRFPPRTLSLTKSRNLTLPSLSATSRPAPKKITPSSSQSMQQAKGQVGVRWLAEDDNRDELRYKVEIRGENETEWKLLEEDLELARLSWDSTAYADGEYRVRVTATDEPGNPPAQALEASLESEPFLIDNTAPVVTGLNASLSGTSLNATWTATDAVTVIAKAEYSLDGGEWTVVQPTTRLSDSKSLDYELNISDAKPGEHTLAIRITDTFENQTVAKVVVR